MKKNLTLFYFLILHAISYAQVNNVKIGYQEFPVNVTGQASDSLGNMYFSGHFKGELKINNAVLETGAGLEDIFLVKQNASGETIFSKSFGSKSSEAPTADALCYFNNNLYLTAQVTDPISFQSFSVEPYSGAGGNLNTGCIINFDTAGNVKWVNKTSLLIGRICRANNIIHILGLTNAGSVKYNDQLLYTATGNTMVHLMLDTSGNLVNYKIITARIPAQNFQVPLFLAAYSKGDLSFLIAINGDNSFQFGNNTIPLPNSANNYFVLVKTDTSYSKFSYKLLNPAHTNFNNTNGPGLTINLSKQDSIYVVVTAATPASVVYDGLTVPAYQKNSLVVFDSFLVAKRVIGLGDPYFANNNSLQRLLFRTINVSGNNLLLTGTYSGLNESLLSQSPSKDSVITIAPNLTANVNLNGVSKSFVVKTSLDFTNSTLTWIGDHSDYENNFLYYRFSHLCNDSLLVLALQADNMWNPIKININSNRVNGAMRPNSDRADAVTFVNYLEDGSRIIIGMANGKTALDTSAVGIKSNIRRGDAFIARITSDGVVKWYKRFYSTLPSASIGKLAIKNNKAYFLINYSSSVNVNNYIVINQQTYSLNTATSASLLASIDTSGNIRVINLENASIKSMPIIDFNFCGNGDMVLLTSITSASFPLFPSSPGFFIFRLNPVTNAIIMGRKLIADNPSAFQPTHAEVDSNDVMYLSVPLNSSGHSAADRFQNLALHDGNNLISTVQYENNIGSNVAGLGILKMDWNGFKWYKRSSGSNGFGLDRSYPEILSANGKIIFMGHPGSIAGNTGNNYTFYWNNALIMSDMNPGKAYFFRMDTSGIIETQKSIDGFEMRYAKKKTNGSLIISGSISKATIIDTVSVGFQGGNDALSFIIDSAFKTTRSYRMASPNFEFMSDMDIWKDSLFSLAYTAQTVPSLYLTRTSSALASDYGADAFLTSNFLENLTALPLQLVYFNATRNGSTVYLDWTIMNKQQGKKYVIQRSENGSEFKDVGTRNAGNNGSTVTYNITDDLPSNGKYYYRLQLISIDDKVSYSKTILVLYPPKANTFYYDNNAQQLHILRTNSTPYQWRIFDAGGRVVAINQETVGDISIELSKVPKGQYIIQTYDGKSIDQTYKFIR